MDTTRISVARVLALDVPLTWRDAVAVAQEAAMLSDVHAAMNSRPSLVSPETCFITRTGDLELPVTTEIESPDAVTLLLREMLAGRDAPEALEALAFGHGTRDMSGELQRFPLANRRADIAKLATRALALQSRPIDEPAVFQVVASTATPDAFPATPSAPYGATPVAPPAWPAAAPASAAPTPGPPSIPGAPFMRQAPFRAADVTRITASVAPPPAVAGAPDAELRRLRTKSVERDKARRRLSQRISLAFGRFGQLVSWRPSSPDPRILGGAVVVTAALVSVVWTNDRPAASVNAVSPAPTSVPAATAPVTRTPAPALSTPPSSTSADLPPAAAGSTTPAAAAAVQRVAAARRDDASAGPRATVLPVPRPAPSAGPPADRTPAPAAGTRSGITVTVPSLDSAPGPLTTNTVPEARPRTPRGSMADGGNGGAAVYSASDDDVSPPVMRRQQLPSAFLELTADVREDWPYLELLIDRWGAVEQVRLHAKQPAPGQTLYRHRMLLAAAKAWEFEPARRQGAPVRYVLRVPLEP